MRLALLAVLLLAAVTAPAFARQDDPRLRDLFGDLQSARTSTESRLVEQKIWRIWSEDGNAQVDALMELGANAMQAGDLDAALDAFNRVVALDDSFAEGFNKRATVEFMRGDYDASVADIERTLKLEPRHFGALSGLGQIYLVLDKKEAALKAFEAALKVNPHLNGASDMVEKLKKELSGKPT
ncbi:MAG TPA: tetratricopeptide repeat protein [Stellaceae bacterium]|nr:tetratricopeptide repeat protein [Stellaceae bacterium]